MNIGRIYRLHSTSSELSRLAKCPPSATLEHFDEEGEPAVKGSAGHEHFEDRAAIGVEAAMARLPELARKWFGNDEREAAFFMARMRKLEWCPPKHAFGEVALAMLEDGSVERTIGGKGYYPELLPGGRLYGKAILAGQTDTFWADGAAPLDLSDPAHPKCPPRSILWSGDYKFGKDIYVDPIESNLQAAANTVMVAKWTGAKYAVPFILYMTPPNGDWDVPSRDGEPIVWGPRELAEAEERVRAVIAARRRAVELVQAGEAVEGFREGSWCTFCPGKSTCPARLASLREVAALAQVPRKRGEGIHLTTEELRWFATRAPMIDSFVKKVRDVLKEHVDLNGPIDLGDGTVWGPHVEETEKILPSKALPILQEEFGDERYAEHFAFDRVARISKDAIEGVVKIVHEEQGIKRQRSKAMGRILGAIREAGGMETTRSVTYGRHRPPPPAIEVKAEEPKRLPSELEGMEIDGDLPEEGEAAE